MKQILLTVLVAGSSLIAQNMAHASDGTVSFSGNIISTACTVDAGSANMKVTLGDVVSSSLASSGSKSSPTAFQIKLTECPDSVANVAVKFDGASDAVNTDLLKLDPGQTATNVGIEIADVSGTPIPLHTLSPLFPVDTVAHTAVLDLTGRYVATGAAGAGTANGTSQFTINYQ
jgi:major type 1 subunit fimbrin (pilin)